LQVTQASIEPGEWRKPSGCIRLFLGGDVMTGRAIDQLFVVHNPENFGKADHVPASQYLAWSADIHGPAPSPVRHDYIWGPTPDMLDRLEPDFRLVNLETAITTSDSWVQKTFNFRMHPANTPCLSAAGLDCCALANNHSLDFGEHGLADTVRALSEAGIGFAGVGKGRDEAGQPYVHHLPDGSRILVHSWAGRDSGVFPSWEAGFSNPGVNYLPDYSETTAGRMARQIADHRKPGDTTIASIHWGGNWVTAVPDAHRQLAHFLVEHGGVDLVHGHSSHHPFAIEKHMGRLILYGCGDLLNDYEGNPRFKGARTHLGAIYFADLDAGTGKLVGLRVVPVQRRRFRLEQASAEDAAWVTNRIRSSSRRS
jgi:poly-gamma-glutamate synthesis protein (capsule biosynthesis protein)